MRAMRIGVQHSFGKRLHPEEAYNVNSGTKKLEWEGRRERENLHGEMKKMFVGTGEVRR